MDNTERTRLDALLDLLADEVAKRLEARGSPAHVAPEPPEVITSVPGALSGTGVAPASVHGPATEPASDPRPEFEPDLAPSTSSHPASLMARLAIGVLIIVALINIPLNAQGTALARSIPSSASLIIRNGLVVKEATSPEFWVYRDGAFHWITSLEAFEHFGYSWRDVHIVEPGFLDPFEKGTPLYVLLKCNDSPHIYRLEGGSKRWIVDIPTFEAEGHVWADVKPVSCEYLRDLPDGESIPPGHGSPPSPSP